MGSCESIESDSKELSLPSVSSTSKTTKETERRSLRQVPSDISIHIVLSSAYDHDHEQELNIPLGDCSDEALVAEAVRRKLDLNSEITDAFVKETYEFGRLLGKGASGHVYLVKHRISNMEYACKIVKWNRVMNDMKSMITEIEIMKRIQHRNIMSMYELYETPRTLWMVLELVSGGDLLHYIRSYENYTEIIASRLMRQILLGIEYLHDHGIVHRDIKPENILLSNSSPMADIKIADFGLSADLGYVNEKDVNGIKTYNKLKDLWGTREYFAPEMIDRKYGFQVDLWSCGCILYEMVIGYQAFPYKYFDNDKSFYRRIKRCKYSQNAWDYGKLSSNLQELISKMIVVDPLRRLSAKECLFSPWIQGQVDKNRITIELKSCRKRINQRLEDRDMFKADDTEKKKKVKEELKNIASPHQSSRSSSLTMLSFFKGKDNPSMNNVGLAARLESKSMSRRSV